MHCIQNNETDCNIRHLLYSPLLVCSLLLCWHCACAVRDRASVGGLRYYYYGFVYLSMPNLLHSPPKQQLSLPSEKWVVLLCAEKKDIQVLHGPHLSIDTQIIFPIWGVTTQSVLWVWIPLSILLLKDMVFTTYPAAISLLLCQQNHTKKTHPTAARQPCRQNSGYPAPISGHPFIVLLTAHCTMYSLGLDCWPCGTGYIHPGHACMPCSLLELEQIDVETMQKLYRRFLWM